MFIHQEVWVSIPENCGIVRIKGKRLTRDLQHGIMSTIKYGFHRVTQVMQLNVNFHTAGKITGCRIICNIFYSCNNITKSVKKNHVLY